MGSCGSPALLWRSVTAGKKDLKGGGSFGGGVRKDLRAGRKVAAAGRGGTGGSERGTYSPAGTSLRENVTRSGLAGQGDVTFNL